MPFVNDDIALDVIKDKTPSADRTEKSGETRKQVFWQTAINYQRSKLNIQLDGNEIKGVSTQVQI